MPRRVPPSADWSLPPAGEAALTPTEAARRLKEAAGRLGFDPVGIAPATLPEADREQFQAWVARGLHGSMGYMARDPEGRVDPGQLLEGAGAVLMVGLAYAPRRDPRPGADDESEPRARIATYAQPPFDYHRVLAGRLELLARHWGELVPGAQARRFCDTAPVLERPFAALAGLGFVGKNTNLIHPRRGSYFFLGGLILDRELPADEPGAAGGCGTCTRCLDACPTDAFPAPYVLDARRCISYLTIEHRGPWEPELRALVGEHAFGCDVCQQVCPWNHKFAAAPDPELAPEPERTDPPLLALYQRTLAGFKSLARDTPWERTGKRGFLRNLATAMGNAGDDRHAEALDALTRHEDPTVADHARWARGRLGDRLGAGPLTERGDDRSPAPE